MTFATLAVILAAGILGPVLAWSRHWQVPVVIGELIAGVLLGRTGIGYLHAANPGFVLLANLGFALVMFVAGSHVPMRNPALRPALWTGLLRAAVVGVAAAVLGVALAAWFGTGHGAMYAVLMASSSAALILPIVDSLRLGTGPVLEMLPQVAIADTVCIVALPLAIDPARAVRAAFGAVAVLAAAGLIFVVLRYFERRGVRHRVHVVSEKRKFALELRINLVILCVLAALAIQMHVSIMLAGFAFGLGVAAIGEPRRLARQLFALTEGFLGPVFFVWLGASLDLRALTTHPSLIGLGLLLGFGAALAHLVPRGLGQPASLGLLAAAQLGVPVAAAAVGTQTGVLVPGEASAMILGALVTITLATVGGSLAARAGLVAPANAVADKTDKS